MPRPIITLMTDFGDSGSYVAQIKGVIVGINPQVSLIDITHTVPPQDVQCAAGILDESLDAFPENTIHLVVVDPGVGSERPIVGVELGGQRFVVPDNGVLSAVARRFRPGRVVQLAEDRFWRTTVSNTFHGRDIMAPVSAYWSLGADLADFGAPLERGLFVLPERAPKRIPGGIEGEVVRRDSFGNLLTNIDETSIPVDVREQVMVTVGSHTIQGIRGYYAQQPAGTVMAIFGSSGRLEIAINRGNAAEELKMHGGEKVLVRGLESAANVGDG